MADFFGNLLGNPMFQMGTALLGQTGYSAAPRTFGQQLGGAMEQFGQMQTTALQQKMAQREAELKEKQMEAQLKAAENRQKTMERIVNLGDKDPKIAATIAMQSGDPELEEWGMKQLFPEPEKYAPHQLEKLYAAEQKGAVPAGTFKRTLEGTPQVSINMGGGGVKYQKVGDQFVPTDAATGQPLGPAVSIPGLERGTAEAARLSLVRQASESLERAKDIVFERDEQGNIKELNESILYKANVPFTAGVGEEARQFNQNINAAIEAAVRINTGAAVTQQEMQIYRELYVPSPMDSKAVAKQKLNSLEQFLGGMEREARGQTTPGLGQQARPPAQQGLGFPGPGTQGMQGMQAPEGSVQLEFPEPEEIPQIQSQQDYQRLPAGTQYIAPDGTLRMKQ